MIPKPRTLLSSSSAERGSGYEGAGDAAQRWIGALRAESPLSFGYITVLPLRAAASIDPAWLLLDEALAAGLVEVSEISEEGAVPTLHVTNSGPLDVLLLDGEELIGAKQNRVLNTTVLVRAGSTVEIPVSCVEQGRWTYNSRLFAVSGSCLYALMRQKNAAQVHASLRASRSYESDQFEIWSDLGTRAAKLRVKSRAMADTFSAYEAELREYELALAARAGQVGALVYGGSAWWGMDTLPCAPLFAKAWPRILSGYVMDALWSRPVDRPRETGKERLQTMLDAAVEVFPGAGAGANCRFLGPDIFGAALVVDGVVAHAMAFPCLRGHAT